MKLAYDLLWVDDQPEQVEGARDRIIDGLARQGFSVNINWAVTPEETRIEIEKLKRYHQYDLILVDYQLKGSESGDSVAEKIRRYTKTEIIFYSSEPPADLRKKIFDKNIDGVYSVNRQRLGVEVMEVISTTIKKVVDLNHMRGIMMSSISELDHVIGDCLTYHYETLESEARESALSRMREKMRHAASSSVAKIDALLTLEDILMSHQFSTMLRFNMLQSFLKTVDLPEIGSLREILITYKDTVDLRNVLAHGRLVEEDDVFKLDGRELELSEETFRQARVDLLKHQTNFEQIREALGSLRAVPKSQK